MIWFTADFHLSHKNIIKYSNRPFKNVEEMDNSIMRNLKELIKADDILYFLGDLTFKKEKALEFFDVLEGIEIHYIIGNHDSQEVIKVASEFCASVSSLTDIYIHEQPITLCHYAMRVWNKSHFNAWQLYGHSHNKLDSIGKQCDVGVDSNNFYPISYENLKVVVDNLPNNFNYIPPDRRRQV